MSEKAKAPIMGTRNAIICYVNQKIEDFGVATHIIKIPLPFISSIPQLVAKGIEKEYKSAGWKSAMLMEIKNQNGYFEKWEIHLIPHNYGFTEEELSSKYDPEVADHPDGTPHQWELVTVDPIPTMRCPICSQLSRKVD